MSIIYILSILLVFLNYNNINNMLYQITHLDHPVVTTVVFCKMEVKSAERKSTSSLTPTKLTKSIRYSITPRIPVYSIQNTK